MEEGKKKKKVEMLSGLESAASSSGGARLAPGRTRGSAYGQCRRIR